MPLKNRYGVAGSGGLRARHIPGWTVAESNLSDLAALDERVQTLNYFFHWREGVPGVHPIPVDVICSQTFERATDRAVEVFLPHDFSSLPFLFFNRISNEFGWTAPDPAEEFQVYGSCSLYPGSARIGFV